MKHMTEDEIQEGIDKGLWHWTGGTGGCGNEYLADGRDPGPWILLTMVVYALFIMWLMP